MKIYIIHNDYENSDNGGYIHEITAYSTRELAERAIKTMIIDEVEQQLSNGTIVKTKAGKIKFDCHDSNCDVEITDTKLCLRDCWGFIDEIWIEELDVVTEVPAQ